MKQVILFILLFFCASSFFAQEIIENKQFMLGVTNVSSSQQVTHHIVAQGVVWEHNTSNFVISSNPDIYHNTVLTIGQANFNSIDWPGFNFFVA